MKTQTLIKQQFGSCKLQRPWNQLFIRRVMEQTQSAICSTKYKTTKIVCRLLLSYLLMVCRIAKNMDFKNNSEPDTMAMIRQKRCRCQQQLWGYWSMSRLDIRIPIQVRKMGDFWEYSYRSCRHITIQIILIILIILLFSLQIAIMKELRSEQEQQQASQQDHPQNVAQAGINRRTNLSAFEEYDQWFTQMSNKIKIVFSITILCAALIFISILSYNDYKLVNNQALLSLQQNQNEIKVNQKEQMEVKQAVNQTEYNQNVSQIKLNKSVQGRGLFKHADLLKQNNLNRINQILKNTFYDIHYFVQDMDQCQHQHPLLLLSASPNLPQQQKILLIFEKSDQQLNKIIQSMMHPPGRSYNLPKIKPVTRVKSSSIDLGYFFYALSQDPTNKTYLQAELYRYNSLYNISSSSYSKQLPLCVSLVGKNTIKFADKLYESLVRQNYSNYRIVHIDDGSADGTVQKIMQIASKNEKLAKRVTLLKQGIRRNQLYNRDMAIRSHCPADSVVLDMDADDYLIGNQVFQLVNTLYQTRNSYRGLKYDLWSLYFAPIVYQPYCSCILPNVDGKIPQNQFTQHTYRSSGKWRTTHLRTFLRSLYLKINITQFIDLEAPRPGYYFPQAPDTFMHSSILQLSGPKHLRVVDEFLYFYTTSLQNMHRRDNSLDIFYSAYSAQALAPYLPLQQLQEDARKTQNFKIPYKTLQNKRIKTRQIIKRRDKIIEQISTILGR